jgi:hypothetical protein
VDPVASPAALDAKDSDSEVSNPPASPKGSDSKTLD